MVFGKKVQVLILMSAFCLAQTSFIKAVDEKPQGIVAGFFTMLGNGMHRMVVKPFVRAPKPLPIQKDEAQTPQSNAGRFSLSWLGQKVGFSGSQKISSVGKITTVQGLTQDRPGHGLHCAFYALYHGICLILEKPIDRKEFEQLLPVWRKIVFNKSNNHQSLRSVTNLEAGDLEVLIEELFEGNAGIADTQELEKLRAHLCCCDEIATTDHLRNRLVTTYYEHAQNGKALMRFKNNKDSDFIVMVYTTSADKKRHDDMFGSSVGGVGGVLSGGSHWVAVKLQKNQNGITSTYVDSLKGATFGHHLISALIAMATHSDLPISELDLEVRHKLGLVENLLSASNLVRAQEVLKETKDLMITDEVSDKSSTMYQELCAELKA